MRNDDIDYVVVGRAVRSMPSGKRKATRKSLEIMASKRSSTAVKVIVMLVFALVFFVAAATGQNPWIVFSAALVGGLAVLIVILVALRLM